MATPRCARVNAPAVDSIAMLVHVDPSRFLVWFLRRSKDTVGK
jgi:hypothetical protein